MEFHDLDFKYINYLDGLLITKKIKCPDKVFFLQDRLASLSGLCRIAVTSLHQWRVRLAFRA